MATDDVSGAGRGDALKDEFVCTVSHELRTPLTSIGGALALLEAGVGGCLQEEQLALVQVALRNTRRLQSLINDLLDMEKLLGGQMVFDRQVQPLWVLLEQAVVDNQPYAQTHGVEFVLEGPDEGVCVEVDGDRVGQVLANYLSNAAKFAPAGSQVDVRLVGGGPRVRVEVIDRGPGVPEEFSSRVFARFAQADPTAHGGTGLGLPISREIIEQHGGEVGYDSRPGRTCFCFDLPTSRQPSSL